MFKYLFTVSINRDFRFRPLWVAISTRTSFKNQRGGKNIRKEPYRLHFLHFTEMKFLLENLHFNKASDGQPISRAL